jgi:uncharacterized membrane protein YgcG
MIDLRPTPEQERWMEMGSRERTQGWVRPKTITRCALFVLGIVGAALTAAVFGFIHIPGSGWIAGLVLVAAAEGLVMRRRFFGAGIEEALEICGLLILVFQTQNQASDPSGVRMSLLAAAALAIAGFRFLNPLFITLSVAALSWAIDHWLGAVMAGIFCFAAAALALWAGGIEFRRPSHDRTLDWLAVIMPLSGYLWLSAHAPAWLLAAFGAAALIVGIQRRTHAPLIAFMVCTVCMAYELRNVTGLSPEARLILWGSAAFLLTLGLGRYLRTPRGGISSNRAAEDDELSDLAQLAGAGVLAPHSVAHSPAGVNHPPEFKGGGGAGGGGGASGTY